MALKISELVAPLYAHNKPKTGFRNILIKCTEKIGWKHKPNPFLNVQ